MLTELDGIVMGLDGIVVVVKGVLDCVDLVIGGCRVFVYTSWCVYYCGCESM